MIYTNNHNLPEPIVKAISSHDHKAADYSASMLTKTARMVWLEKRHYDEIETDVMDGFWALLGTAIHGVLEDNAGAQALAEEYLTAEIAGRKVSGISDLYEDSIINDWKTMSVWGWVFFKEREKEYESQLNTYGYLFRKAGYPVEGLNIVMIFRDWMMSKAKQGGDYPDAPVKQVRIKLWSFAQQEAYLHERIAYFEQYRDTPDADLPECTPEERWAKPSKWAVMKEGRKSAVRVLETENEALNYISNNALDSKHYVEERRADMFKRCEYCNAAQFCSQYQAGINEG